MTLGQYYPADSVIHRLDPRVKLGGTFVYIISLFLSRKPQPLVFAAAVLMLTVLLARIPVGFLIRAIRPVLFILLFSAVFHIFGTPGKPLWEWWILRITGEGCRKAAFFSFRLILLIMGSSVMTFTTTPGSLADGLEKSLGFLKIFRLPVHEFAMITGIALRFIPILTEELDKIMKAQTARGMDFDRGNPIERLKKLVPILIPLFVAAVGRASDLALAMEARCYQGGDGRTKLHPLVYKRADYAGWLFIFCYFAVMAAMAVRLH